MHCDSLSLSLSLALSLSLSLSSSPPFTSTTSTFFSFSSSSTLSSSLSLSLPLPLSSSFSSFHRIVPNIASGGSSQNSVGNANSGASLSTTPSLALGSTSWFRASRTAVAGLALCSLPSGHRSTPAIARRVLTCTILFRSSSRSFLLPARRNTSRPSRCTITVRSASSRYALTQLLSLSLIPFQGTVFPSRSAILPRRRRSSIASALSLSSAACLTISVADAATVSWLASSCTTFLRRVSDALRISCSPSWHSA
mmetsp:Transcript_58702/g.143905  ORF Transcript_58702/g.143905 Transcript_58702/m.143905 type:complete len:254 (+) Transcript_58702:2-763(+)